MWFKQVTCDNCFNPLESTGRHNCYVSLRVIRNKIMPWNIGIPSSNPYLKDYPFTFLSCNTYKPRGNIYMYAIEQEDMNLENRLCFCSTQCAYNSAIKNNLMMLYYDDDLQTVRGITQHLVEINRELGGNDYRGLNFQFPYEWVISKDSFTDLRMYNKNIQLFPELNYPYTLTAYSSQDKFDYLNLLLDKSFQYSFYGSNNFPKENVSNIEEHVNTYKLNFNRRFGIEWIIRESGKFIGFIRMNCINPNDPYNWYIEFGLIENKRSKGIMKNTLNQVLKWCVNNGLDKIYATSEIHNTACENLMQSTPYSIQKTRISASDKFAGNRPLNRYMIDFAKLNQNLRI